MFWQPFFILLHQFVSYILHWTIFFKNGNFCVVGLSPLEEQFKNFVSLCAVAIFFSFNGCETSIEKFLWVTGCPWRQYPQTLAFYLHRTGSYQIRRSGNVRTIIFIRKIVYKKCKLNANFEYKLKIKAMFW